MALEHLQGIIVWLVVKVEINNSTQGSQCSLTEKFNPEVATSRHIHT